MGVATNQSNASIENHAGLYHWAHTMDGSLSLPLYW